MEMSFHDAAGHHQLDASPLVSKNSSNNGSCELHSTKSQSSDFRTMFGSSPLLNYNPVTTTTSRLDNIPLKYRRGYSNLNEACLSRSTSNIVQYQGYFAQKSMHQRDSTQCSQIDHKPPQTQIILAHQVAIASVKRYSHFCEIKIMHRLTMCEAMRI